MPVAKRKDIVLLVGMAAFCAMLRAPFVSVLIAPSQDPFNEVRFAYDATLVILGLVFLLGFTGRSSSALSRFGGLVALAASGFLASLGVVALNVLRASGITCGIPVILGIVAVGIGFAGLTAAWFAVLASRRRERIAVLTLAAFLFSHVFFVVDLLSRSVAAYASAVYPAVSAISLIYAFGETCEEGLLNENLEERLVSHGGYFKRLRLVALILIMVEVFCDALLRSRWAMGGAGYDPTTNSFITYLFSALIGLLFLIIAKKAHSTSEEALVIGGIGLLGFFAAAVLFSVLPASVLAPFVTGLYSALLVFSMALLVLWGADGDHEGVRASGVFLVLYGLVSCATTTLIPVILQYRGVMPDEHLVPVGIVAGLLASLGVGAVLFFMVFIQRSSYIKALEDLSTSTRPRIGEADASMASEPSAREIHDRAMERVAAQYGLTQRERQTASLVAQGYSFKRVAEKLCVAPATVQGYSKSIYRKMGIHKKDELIEVVDCSKRAL